VLITSTSVVEKNHLNIRRDRIVNLRLEATNRVSLAELYIAHRYSTPIREARKLLPSLEASYLPTLSNLGNNSAPFSKP